MAFFIGVFWHRFHSMVGGFVNFFGYLFYGEGSYIFVETRGGRC